MFVKQKMLCEKMLSPKFFLWNNFGTKFFLVKIFVVEKIVSQKNIDEKNFGKKYVQKEKNVFCRRFNPKSFYLYKWPLTKYCVDKCHKNLGASYFCEYRLLAKFQLARLCKNWTSETYLIFVPRLTTQTQTDQI